MLGPPAAGVSRYPRVVPGWRRRIACTRKVPTVNSPGSTCCTVSFADSASNGTGNTAGSICWRRIASSDVVPWREERLEVGQPLDMVPVRVRQQDLRLHGAVLALHQLASQRADPGARVEDDQLAPSLAAAGALHGDARRIAAVARGVSSGGGDGAPRPPKGHRVGHPSRQRRTLWAKLWKIREVGQAAASPDPSDPPHDRPADASSAPRSRITISRRLISM